LPIFAFIACTSFIFTIIIGLLRFISRTFLFFLQGQRLRAIFIIPLALIEIKAGFIAGPFTPSPFHPVFDFFQFNSFPDGPAKIISLA